MRVSSQDVMARVAAMFDKYPDRFLFGTDNVAPSSIDANVRVFHLWDPIFAKVRPADEAGNLIRQLRTNFRRRADEGAGVGATPMFNNKWSLLASVACVLLTPRRALAQDAGTLPTPSEQKAEVKDQSEQPQGNMSPADQLKLLQLERRDMQQRMNDFDARIRRARDGALE